MGSVVIRQMTEADLQQVYDVQCAAYAEVFHEDISVFKDALDDYDKTSFVAVEDGKIIGYLLSQPSDEYRDDFDTGVWDRRGDEEFIYLHDACVSPDHRGKDAASQLVKTFNQKAKDLGFKAIVGVSVQRSEGFWKKMGFTMVSPDTYNGEPAFYMKKEL